MDISLTGKIILHADITIFGIICFILWLWQLDVLKGGSVKNPDGTRDDWHEQKIYYGIAFADITIAVPVALLGIAFIFAGQVLGYYLTGMAAFWYLWANVMTTATSLRFAKPKITFMWLLVFPFQAIVALVYLIWTLVYFDQIFVNSGM